MCFVAEVPAVSIKMLRTFDKFNIIGIAGKFRMIFHIINVMTFISLNLTGFQ